MIKQPYRKAADTDKKPDLATISVAGQAHLLDLAYSRLRFGLFAMPFVSATFAWYYGQSNDDFRVIFWSLGYFCAAVLALIQRNAYQRDRLVLSAEVVFKKWLPRIQTTAMIHGFGLAVLLPLVSNTASIELKYLYVLTVAAIMAGNATHQSPVLSVFNRFLTTGWHLTVLMMPWSLASHWQFVMPLSVIYSIGMYRHALASHRFFVQLVWLEEEGARLTERYKAATEEAENTLTEKSLFLTTASHDLRQPVHAMAMLVEAISQRNLDPVMSPLLMDLKSSMSSMTMMFNSLLDLSKLEAGVVATRTSHVSLTLLLNDIVILFREQASQRGLTLRVHVPDRAAVWADPALLRQALVNLVHNALRYTARGGLLIGVRPRGAAWQIEVWDTGVGIAETDGQQIFSPYYRSQHAWGLNSAGHGLGLAVVARCVQLMDAPLDFKSRLGKGSCFWLRLPMSQLADVAKPEPTDSTVKLDLPLPPLAGCCLVLDDDPQVLAAWKALLESWGVTGSYAADSTQAMQLLDAGTIPDAIFCDQRLRSGESGFDVLKALLNRFPQACGAMVSGEFHSPELQDAENEGYLVLSKPLEPGQLHAVLSTWLPCDVPFEHVANQPNNHLQP
jgi:signal transduction histidine kinase/CheY-like chemotaxis protein